jgi:hypothetical protein
MPTAIYLRDRAARFRDLASRARDPADECYLLWTAAEAEHQADTMDGTPAREDGTDA